jgi:hypothetical protein
MAKAASPAETRSAKSLVKAFFAAAAAMPEANRAPVISTAVAMIRDTQKTAREKAAASSEGRAVRTSSEGRAVRTSSKGRAVRTTKLKASAKATVKPPVAGKTKPTVKTAASPKVAKPAVRSSVRKAPPQPAGQAVNGASPEV